MEVLAADAGVWDLPDVRRRLDALLEAEGYEIVVTISPTATTHGHHQAAALLAVEAAARRPHGQRPVLLCCQVETADAEGARRPPRGSGRHPPGAPEARRGPVSSTGPAASDTGIA